MKDTCSRALFARLIGRDRDAVDAQRARRGMLRGRDEAGAVLVLALMFLVVIGLLVGALASWTANDLTDSVSFQQDRSAQYALSGATQVAIQSIRYTPLLDANQTLNASPPSYCWGNASPSQLTFGTNAVDVWCSTVWNPTSASTRVVTVSACLTSVTTSPSVCAANPGLQTVVTFDDYSATNPTINPGVCLSPPNGTCGSGMTINSSTIKTISPTVTALSATNGPVTGGAALTVTGTGFVSGSTTVNFVSTTASQNIVVPGVGVTVNSSTSLSVTTPAVTTVTSYYVIVTTPNGSSPAGPQFTYQPVVPTVTSVATSAGTTSGSAAGGSSITIVGSGFLSSVAGDNTTVTFVDTANTSIVLPALYDVVNSSTSITATTPAITTDTTYYVVVTTAPGGTSAYGPTFTFQPFTPVVASVSPTSGGSGTSVTLTGVGFVNGATTVSLIPTGGFGGTLTATNVDVSASTVLTATIPSGGSSNQTYYVEVTTTTGGPSCPNNNCSQGGTPVVYTY